MTKLSVNINKFATLRNARGGNLPDILKTAKDCEAFGAQGITVHPRPDGRHIRYSDVLELKPILNTEFNIEGNPIHSFMELVLRVKPRQVTLVPDAHDAVTSNSGWDTTDASNRKFLSDICRRLREEGIRSSIFIDPIPDHIRYAAQTGCDRIELYTESYAANFHKNKEEAIESYYNAALVAIEMGLGINAGHDLNLDNLKYFHQTIPELLEVSIGHALVCEAIYLGLENTIKLYLRELK